MKIHGLKPPVPLVPKGNKKFEILLVKVWNEKQIQYFQLLKKNLNFVSSRKQSHVPLEYNF